MVRMLEWCLDSDQWAFTDFECIQDCAKGREALEVIAFHEWDGNVEGAIVVENGGMMLWYSVSHWEDDDIAAWEMLDAEDRFSVITEDEDGWAWVGDKVSL
jgi:hypothetical protein